MQHLAWACWDYRRVARQCSCPQGASVYLGSGEEHNRTLRAHPHCATETGFQVPWGRADRSRAGWEAARAAEWEWSPILCSSQPHQGSQPRLTRGYLWDRKCSWGKGKCDFLLMWRRPESYTLSPQRKSWKQFSSSFTLVWGALLGTASRVMRKIGDLGVARSLESF